MLSKAIYLIAVLSPLTMAVAQVQQGTSSAPQTAQTQTAPCTAAPSPARATQTNSSGSSIIGRLKKKLNDESAKLGTQTGVPMPTTDDIGKLANSTPPPCPPKTAAPAQPAAAVQAAPVKLPPDTLVTLRCNPMTPSPQGASHQTTLTLPDPKDFAVPKANDFLADSVVPDTAAKTPCYLIKVDPKTGKSFIQQ